MIVIKKGGVKQLIDGHGMGDNREIQFLSQLAMMSQSDWPICCCGWGTDNAAYVNVSHNGYTLKD